MARAFGLITVVIVVAAGGYFYTRQAQSVTAMGGNPKSGVELIAVRNDLMALANAERRFWALNARYATFDELRGESGTFIPTRPDFTYSADTTGEGFHIIAIYSGPDSKAPVRLTIDESMNLTETRP